MINDQCEEVQAGLNMDLRLTPLCRVRAVAPERLVVSLSRKAKRGLGHSVPSGKQTEQQFCAVFFRGVWRLGRPPGSGGHSLSCTMVGPRRYFDEGNGLINSWLSIPDLGR
jgi:hypothetical protein